MSYGVYTELEKLKKQLQEKNGTSTSTTTTITPVIKDTGYGVYDELRKLQEQQNAKSTYKPKQKEESLLKKDKEEESLLDKDEDIAPVKEEEENSWFQKGALADGISLKNIGKAILGTNQDASENFLAGIVGMGEKAVDALATIAPYLAQGMFYQNGGGFAPIEVQQIQNQAIDVMKQGSSDFVQKDLYDEKKVAKALTKYTVANAVGGADNSVLGTKSDALIQSGGQLAGTAALSAAGVPWYLTTGVTSFGSESESALKQGASLEEATLSAAVTAGAEILTEKISAGINFGGKTFIPDELLAQQIGRTISDKTARTLVKLGVDAAGEGFEEVLSNAISAVGQKLTYDKDKDISAKELFFSEEAFDNFIGGVVLSGGIGSVNAIKTNVQGGDYATGLTNHEKAVVDKEYKNRVAEAEKNGKLSQAEKSKIYEQVLESMDKGYISIDTIEEAIGGDTYKAYQDAVKSEDALKTEFETLNKMKQGDMTGEQLDRRAELKELLKQSESEAKSSQLKSKLSEEVAKLAKDSRLVESYNEVGRRTQKFEADLSQYDAKQQEVIKKAVESGILNNSNRTHEFVDLVAKISADKGVLFDFTNNAKLKESGFAIDGKQINGYVTKDGVTVNIQSAKSLNSVVGHEISHVLEGTELYTELQNAVVEYAKAKGDYQGRYDTLAKLYEGVEGANIDAELTADLVGDYLFTDADFINNLSTNHRNVFEKIYDEVKYLLKVATAGSKEAQQLEKVKRAFEKAYRADSDAQKNTTDDGGVKYSLKIEHTDGTVEELADLRNLTDDQVIQYLESARAFNIFDDSYIPVRKELPQVIIDSLAAEGINVENRSLVMKVFKARREMRKDIDKNGKRRGHGLTPRQLVDIINDIENPVKIIYQTNRVNSNGDAIEDNVAVFVRYSKNGVNGFATVEFTNPDRTEVIGKEFGETDFYTVDTAFFPDTVKNGKPYNYMEVLENNPNNFVVEIKRRQDADSANREKHPSTTDELPSSDAKVAQEEPAVKKQFSLSDSETDTKYLDAVSRGDTLIEQRMVNEAAKTSGAIMDERGRKPLALYHGTGSFGFTKFKDGLIFATNDPSISAGYTSNKGYGRQRKISETYTEDDGSVETLIKNARNILELDLHQITPDEQEQIREYLRQASAEMSIRADDAWTNAAMDALGDVDEQLANDIAWVLSLPGSVNENIDDLGGYLSAEELENWLDHFDESLPRFREFLSERRNELKDTPAWDMFKLVMGYDLGDYAIDVRYKLHRSLDDSVLVSETGGLVDQENIRERIEREKDVGSYKLYGFAGDNPLIIDGNGSMWTDIPVDAFGGARYSTDSIGKKAKEMGYTSVQINDIYDMSMNEYAVNKRSNVFIFFDSNQLKSADPVTYDDNGKVIPLSERFNAENKDIRNSLTAEGQELPTYGNYNVYGKDIALETDDIAPIAENAALVAENDTIAAENSAEDLFPDDLAPVQEEYENLLAERDDIQGAMDAYAAIGDTASAEQLMGEYEAVQARIAEIESEDAERFASLDEADAPVEMDNAPEDVADNVPLTKVLVNNLARTIKAKLGLANNQMAEVRGLIERYSAEEFPSKAHLYTEIAERFGRYTESYVDEELKGVKALLRTYGIKVDDSIKRDIADYGQLRKSNFGKVRFSNEGLPVDVAYQEFQEALPGLFPASVDVPSDQLLRIIEVANMDTTFTQEYDIDSEMLEEITDTIMQGVAEFKQNRKETLANRHGRESFNSLMESADQYVPPVQIRNEPPRATQRVQASPDDIAPVFDTSSGQQAIMPEIETPKPLTRSVLHENIMDNIKTTFAESGFDFDNVLKKAKDLSTFATVDNTPQRVMEKALGYKAGQTLSDLTVNKVAQNETDGIRWLNSFTDRKNGLLAKISKQYHIKPGSKASAAAQMYAEGFYVGENDAIIAYGDRELAADFPNAKVQENIKRLARDPRIRQIYDETLAAINESRKRNAYPEIPRLDNYFLHFRAMDDTFSRLGLPFNPNDIRAKDLPTDLNGVTADLKPGQPYFASAMHRKGKRTSFDLLGGLENYLTSAKNQIYHIDDIQTLRALRNYIAETYGQASGLENLDLLSDEEAEQRIEQVYNSHLSTFAKFLNEEANVLAGKTALIDRGLEGVIGRRGMTFMNTLNKQVGANMVGFNVSSSLTNFLAPVQAFAKTNKFDFAKAMAQTAYSKLGSIFGINNTFAEESPVMIRRKGAERFYRTPYQKVGDAGYVLMGVVDDISTELIARTKYNEFTRKGMDSQQAHIETDKWVSRLMGDRSLGQQPQLYNSKTLGLITKFQLEVRNQLDSQFYDTIQEAKVSAEHIENGLLRNAKKAAKITSTFVQLAVMQHLFGKAFESVAGYNPAFDIIEVLIKSFGWDDEEDSEDTVLDNIEQGFMELLGDLPYTSTLTGGRIPIASALPIQELIQGKDQYGNEKSRWQTLGEAAPYYILPGGYGQIKKTKAGLDMFSDDHPIAGSYTDSGNLRFPVEDTFGNRVQAGLFGQWASENARDYFDNERKPLNEKQTSELINTDMPIAEYWAYLDGLRELDTLQEKVDYIAGLDLPTHTKNMLVNNIADRKEAINLVNYDQYSSLEEMDFAIKNPEKYAVAQAIGGYAAYRGYQVGMKGLSLAEKADYIAGLNLTTEQKNILINSETDRKEPIDLTGYENYSSFEEFEYAKKNPESYALAKSVGGYEAYLEYSEALGDIKADKNQWGESISGSRKPKVYNYIYSLNIPEIEKHILFKSQYPSTDTYNLQILEYLDSREDISWDELKAVLLKLDFKVSDDGRVRW